jgi:hypothetical protein
MTFLNYNIFYKDASTEEKKQFTSINSIKNNNGKLSLVKNFFDTDYIVHRFKVQGLQPLWIFSYVDEYNISFLGKKRITTSPQQQEQKQKSTLSKTTLNDEQKQGGRKIVEDISTTKKKILNLKEQLKVAEIERMNCGLESRKIEKLGQWDEGKYAILKDCRVKFNSIYTDILNCNKKVEELRNELWKINNSYKESVVHNDEENIANLNDKQQALLNTLNNKNNVIFNVIDPGIHPTATMLSESSKSLFLSVNRYNLMSSEEPYDDIKDSCYDNVSSKKTLNVTPSFINNIIFDTKQKRKREKEKKRRG